MSVSVTCPSCSARVRLPDDSAGKKFRCPKCKGVIPGQGFAPAAKTPVVRSTDRVDSGLVDESEVAQTTPPDEQPLPISSAARQASRESFNPFAGGNDEDEEDKPRKKRYWQPKENYNPFDDVHSSSADGATANPEQVFDFGEPEAGEAPPPSGDFDFGSGGVDSQGGRR